MTKLEFLTHVFSTIRREIPGKCSPIGLLAMLQLSQKPGEWMSSQDLAPVCDVESNKLAASLAPSVDCGWIIRRKEGHSKSSVDWQLSPEGRAFLELLLKPQPQPVPA